MRSNTREPHARRLPALLAVRSLAPGRAAAHGRRLSARLARAPPPRPPALARRPPRRVPRRARGHRPGPGVAGRDVCRPAAPGPYGAAPGAHDVGTAAPLVGRAAVPLAPGPATARAQDLGRPMAVRAAAAPALWPPDPPADGARPLRRRHLGLARPTRLRPGPALERLALPAARVLPGDGPRLLVSHRPALPGPAALVALAAVSVPVPGRPVEHRPGGPADVLQPLAVPLLRGGAAPGGTFPPGRPIGRGRCHVGAGLRGVPPTAVRQRRPALVRPGGERQESEVGGRRSGVRSRRSRDKAAPEADLIARGESSSDLRPPTGNLWL